MPTRGLTSTTIYRWSGHASDGLATLNIARAQPRKPYKVLNEAEDFVSSSSPTWVPFFTSYVPPLHNSLDPSPLGMASCYRRIPFFFHHMVILRLFLLSLPSRRDSWKDV